MDSIKILAGCESLARFFVVSVCIQWAYDGVLSCSEYVAMSWLMGTSDTL